jgi:endo-1,4-beta-xylanase
LLTKHFNSITTENEMKFDALEPNENQFNYGTADQMVNYATSHNMKVRGHALVWYRQTPAWVFANATKDILLGRMRNHISNVMKHFKGKVYAWDVVNEAMMEDGDYRKGDEAKEDQRSQWYQIAGPDYIAEAFKAAAAADPSAKLFYNDYYDWLPVKNQGIYKMLKGLLDAGVKVDGVGMQCHINIEPSTDPNHQAYYQTVPDLEDAIKLYSSLGLDVQVTELDLSLYIPGITYTSDQYYTTATFTPTLQQQQADRYREFFELFRKYKDVITGVTFWGISDDNTWLSEFSSGRKDFPLLFDVNQQPKPAFYAVVDF